MTIKSSEILNNMQLGEKLETIVLNRISGSCGEFLGEKGSVTKCYVDGVVYMVKRNVEVGFPFWTVINCDTGAYFKCEDEWGLCCLRSNDFVKPSVIEMMGMVGINPRILSPLSVLNRSLFNRLWIF